MPWRLALSLLHVNINSMDIQGNPLLNVTGNGGTYISQANISDRPQSVPTYRTSGHSAYSRPVRSTHSMDRCVETQARIRRKLDEACERPGAIYGIDVVAQAARNILALIDGNPPFTISISLVHLAMNAYAVSYIALISCLYGLDEDGRRRITRATVRKLRRFLERLHQLLVNETLQTGLLVRIKRVIYQGKKNNQIRKMHEELLDILRDIEKDENADIMASLNIALECPYQ